MRMPLLAGRNQRERRLRSQQMPALALSGHTETDRYLSAFGAQRTCREGQKRFGLTQMTQSGHEQATFAAMHSPDLLYSP
jgi:hypothetical protein